MRKVLSYLQILLVFLWTATCATLGTLFLLISFGNSNWALYTASRLWSPVILGVCGVKLEVEGAENIPSEGHFIFIANHGSLFDIPVLFMAIPRPLRFIAKKELKKVPFMGWYMTLIGMVYVDRKNKEKAKQSLNAAGKLIRNGKDVISFPEGTRSKDGSIGLFRRGSFIIANSANVSLIPCGIKGAHSVLPPGSSMIRGGIIRVKVGSPIHPHEHREKSVEELAAFAQQQVKKLRNK